MQQAFVSEGVGQSDTGAEECVEPTGVKVSARRLSAWFGAKRVLHDIDLDLPARRIFAIIGPSGCGKSTFIRCLNRMHELTKSARVSGEVKLDGQAVYGAAVDPVLIRRRIGMVFQRPNPFPTMSVEDNVLVGLRLAGRLPGTKDELLERVLQDAALWDEVKDGLRRPAGALSGGQQQRLCIARALAVEPEVLLMDEPCSALDPIATAKVEELVHRLGRRYSVVIVTHNMQQAARVSDMTAFFFMGELVEVAPTDDLFTRPTHSRTEEYITGRFG